MKNRYLYIDALKVFALFSVITLHVSGEYVGSFTMVSAYDWTVANIYNGISRAGVPLFFMISGVLLLSKKLTIGTMINKVVKRLIIPLFFWSIIYIIFQVWFINEDINFYKHIIASIIRPEYSHLWFMMLSFIPLLYLLLIGENVQCKRNAWIYIGFPILGYMLSNLKYSLKMIVFSTIIGIIAISLSIYNTYIYSVKSSSYINYFYYNINFFIILYASSIFILFKFIFLDLNPSHYINKIIIMISRYSLGIYMVHMIVLFFINKFSMISIESVADILFDSILVLSISIMKLLENTMLKKII